MSGVGIRLPQGILHKACDDRPRAGLHRKRAYRNSRSCSPVTRDTDVQNSEVAETVVYEGNTAPVVLLTNCAGRLPAPVGHIWEKDSEPGEPRRATGGCRARRHSYVTAEPGEDQGSPAVPGRGSRRSRAADRARRGGVGQSTPRSVRLSPCGLGQHPPRSWPDHLPHQLLRTSSWPGSSGRDDDTPRILSIAPNARTPSAKGVIIN